MWKWTAWILVGVLLIASAAAYEVVDSHTHKEGDLYHYTSYPRFMSDEEGQLRNITDVLTIDYDYDNQEITYSFPGGFITYRLKGNAGIERAFSEIIGHNPNINVEFIPEDKGSYWKYTIKVDNIPVGLTKNLDKVIFEIVEMDGVTLDNITVQGESIIVLDKYLLGFFDLPTTGKDITLNVSRVEVHNVSHQVTLVLDPIFSLTSTAYIPFVGRDVGGSLCGEDVSVESGTPEEVEYAQVGSSECFYLSINFSGLLRIVSIKDMSVVMLAKSFINTSYLTEPLMLGIGNNSWINGTGGANLSDVKHRLALNASQICSDGAFSSSWNANGYCVINTTTYGNDELGKDDSFLLFLNMSNMSAPLYMAFMMQHWNPLGYSGVFINMSYEFNNTAPTASNLTIIPTSPYAGQDLTCTYDYADVDGDSESGTTISWFENDVDKNITGATLSGSYVEGSHVWKCNVTPSDSYSNGTAVLSDGTVVFSPSGGGGGSTIIKISPESLIILDWSIPRVEWLIVTTPTETERLILVKNIGQRNMIGVFRMEGDIESIVSAEWCEINLESCSSSIARLPAGDSAVIRLQGRFPGGFRQYTEGLFSVQDSKTKETFSLVVSAQRPPFAYIDIKGFEFGYVAFSNWFDVTEKEGIVMYIIVLLVLVFMGVSLL